MTVVSFPLTNGGHALVDEEDLQQLAGRRWTRVRCGNKWYVCCDQAPTLPRRLYMHRFLMGVHESSRPLVDHRDGDGLNNTRRNLRLATPSLNSHNRQSNSEYRGVFRAGKGYVARVANVYGGLYEHQAAAAAAADVVAIRLYGDDAILNFPADLGHPVLTARFLEVS